MMGGAGHCPVAGETVASARRRIAKILLAAGIEDAADETRRLLAMALDWTGADLVKQSSAVLSAEQRAAVAGYLDRRLRHEPLTRIAGTREFYGRSFKVTPATLDPRADTEVVIEAACALLADFRQKPLRILDIGTGSGAIILTLLAEFANARGTATDISGGALQVARENARALALAERVTFVETDLAAGIDGPFDLVVSNPPYIRSGDIAGLHEGVRDFDPGIALDGGEDGLDVYRRLADVLPNLAPGGTILLEVGFDQWDAVAEIVSSGFSRCGVVIDIRAFADVATIRRVVAARARSSA